MVIGVAIIFVFVDDAPWLFLLHFPSMVVVLVMAFVLAQPTSVLLAAALVLSVVVGH